VHGKPTNYTKEKDMLKLKIPTMWLKLLMILLVPTLSIAKAPTPFQDSQIKRTLEDGTKQSFDGNKYKIVPRNGKRRPIKIIKVTKKIYYKVPEKRKNISIHAGYAPVGLDKNGNSARFVREAVIGLSYSQKFGRNLRFQVMGLTNKSIIGGLGIDF